MRGELPIKLMLVATSYPTDDTDWRGIFIRHQLEAVSRRDGIRASAWVPPGPIPKDCERVTTFGDDRFLSALAARGGIAHLLRTARVSGLQYAFSLLRRLRAAYARSPASSFLVNWLQNALVLPRDNRPALLTVLGSDIQLLALPGMRFALRRALRGRPVAVCPNAEWMVPQLESAFGDIAQVRFVPFGIDPAWYSIERTPVRPNRWLVVSRLTGPKLGRLFGACHTLFTGGQRELHLYGPMQDTLELPPWVFYHGPATPSDLVSLFASAAGLLSLSEHAEGRPQVMLEAMASALPIVASPLPAHRDLLESGRGWIVESDNELARALAAAESDEGVHRGLLARAWAAREIGTWDDCAQRYHSVLSQLLKERA